jgi:hypothetical protein
MTRMRRPSCSAHGRVRSNAGVGRWPASLCPGGPRWACPASIRRSGPAQARSCRSRRPRARPAGQHLQVPGRGNHKFAVAIVTVASVVNRRSGRMFPELACSPSACHVCGATGSTGGQAWWCEIQGASPGVMDDQGRNRPGGYAGQQSAAGCQRPLAQRVADLRAAWVVLAGRTWRDPGPIRSSCPLPGPTAPAWTSRPAMTARLPGRLPAARVRAVLAAGGLPAVSARARPRCRRQGQGARIRAAHV